MSDEFLVDRLVDRDDLVDRLKAASATCVLYKLTEAARVIDEAVALIVSLKELKR